MPTKVDYHEYMASREWRLKRREYFDFYGEFCQRCALVDASDLHHLSYERLGAESIYDDLLGVCRPCHEFLSGVRDDDPAEPAILAALQTGIEPYRGFDGGIWLFWAAKPSSPSLCFTLHSESEVGFKDRSRSLRLGGVVALYAWVQV